MKTKGALIAASVAGLFASAAPLLASADKTAGDSISCEGINACKGKGGCAQKGHDCAGKNACKGKGVTTTTTADCTAKKGKIVKSM
ncbi:MAG: hypothetical protein ABI321_17790 [Polyangia bacterium]